MSTLKSINLQHPSSASPNIVLDSSGNATMAGTMAMATPFGMRNRIINGGMVIDQRYAGTATPNTINGYTLDRWVVNQSVTGKLIAQQSSTIYPAGFSNSLGITSQSAYSVLSSDYYAVSQYIEGFNFYDMAWGTANAKTVTLSFQVYSSLTGTFGGSLRNNASNRSYPFTYTISSANTWTTVSITIPGDTTGTWVGATNSVGVNVNFGLGVGSTFSGAAGAWSASNLLSATGATSVVGTNGATFYITGVQLERGTQATPFEWRPYPVEFTMCQRYYETGNEPGVYIGGSSLNAFYFSTLFKVTKRATPTIATANWKYWSGGSAASFTPTIGFIYTGQFSAQITGSGISGFYEDTGTWTAAAEL